MQKLLFNTLIIGLTLFFSLSSALFAQKSERVEELEVLLKRTNNDTGKVKYLEALFGEYIKRKPLKAKQYAERALRIAERNNLSQSIVNNLDNIGDVYHSQGAYDKAIDYYLRALLLNEKSNDLLGMADSYNKLANVYVLQKNEDKGLAYYKKALDIYKDQKSLINVTKVNTNIGVAYFRKEDFNKSILYHQRALEFADSTRNKKIIAYNLDRLAQTYIRQKDFKNAKKALQQELHLAQYNRDILQEYLLSAYRGLSQAYAGEREYKRALEYYRLYAKEKEIIQTDRLSREQLIRKQQQQQKELEIEKRKSAEAENQRKTVIQYFSLSVLVFLVLVITLLFFNNRKTQRTNRLLAKQKGEIEKKNKKLEEQKDEIEAQKTAIQNKNHTLESTFKEIERKNKDITASINYAKRIQESMLPRSRFIGKYLPEHFILFRPRDIVSGDFYWFSVKSDKIIIAAVDCTGHGIPGAFMSMLGDSYLNQIINLQGITNPTDILNELHKSIGIALNQEETKNQDGMDVAICVIDKSLKKVQFSGAGRPLLVVRSGQHEEVTSSRLPTGGFQKDRVRNFVSHTIEVTEPTSFYVFSDGFQDQFGGKRGRKYAKKRLFNTIAELEQKPISKQRDLLNQILVDWMGENRQMDDILVIGFKLG